MEIQALAFGGDGVGRRADGKVVFVPLTVPGDRVEVRVTEERRRHCRAELVHLLAPGPARRPPACELVGSCGGCQWQQLTYEAQVAAKRDIFATAVRSAPVLPAPQELGYRRRVRLRWSRNEAGLTLGLLKRASHDVLDVPRCPLLEPGLQRGLDLCREMLLQAPPGRGSVAMLVGDGGELHVSLRPAAREHEPALARILEGSAGFAGGMVGRFGFGRGGVDVGGDEPRPLRAGADSFVQANAAQNLTLNREVQKQVDGGRVLELFAGVGNLTRTVGRSAKEVVAVESSASSVSWLRWNAASIPCDVEVIQGRAGSEARRLAARGERFDLVLVDPPREGCPPSVLEAVADLEPGRLIYVSCDPMTLARDLKALAALGFRLESASALDMMPQTFHIEAVIVLEREDG